MAIAPVPTGKGPQKGREAWSVLIVSTIAVITLDTLGGAMGLGYVPCKGEAAADVLASGYEIDVMGTKVRAEASLRPMYDPKSERVKV